MADLVLDPHKKYASAYIDDVVVGSHTFKEHLKNLDAVFQSFENAGITFKLEKCEFVKPKITLLGYIVGSNEMQVVDSKIEAIQKIPYPTCKKEVRQYLGMTNYFRHFIQNFSELASPLTELTKSKSCNRFVLNDVQKNAFDELKRLLSSAPILISPDYSKVFHMYCDSSDVGIGSVLGQNDEKGVFHPIGYCSKKFSQSERNWSIVDEEAYSILHSLRHFEVIVFGYPLVVYSDHGPLQYISSGAKTSPKLLRWSIAIQKYNPTIVAIKGTDNISDALSRLL